MAIAVGSQYTGHYQITGNSYSDILIYFLVLRVCKFVRCSNMCLLNLISSVSTGYLITTLPVSYCCCIEGFITCMITLKGAKNKIVKVAFNEDPYEAAHNDPSHLNLPCLSSSL